MEEILNVGLEQQVILLSLLYEEQKHGHVAVSMVEQIAQRVQQIEILPQCVGEPME
jgi:hypothetical protein